MAALPMRTRVLGAYRALQRSQRSLFAGGAHTPLHAPPSHSAPLSSRLVCNVLILILDTEAIVLARERIRAEFDAHRRERDAAQLEALLQYAHDVRQVLDKSVVQVAQEGSTARVHLRPTTHFTRNRDATDVLDDDLRWPHEQQAEQPAGACATRCGGCACE